MSLRSVDVDLLEHVELDPEAGSKLFDLGAGAGLLGPELVAGEGEDGQLTLGLQENVDSVVTVLCSHLVVLFEQLYQLRVVDLGLASLGGHVDHDTDLPGVLAELHLRESKAVNCIIPTSDRS